MSEPVYDIDIFKIVNGQYKRTGADLALNYQGLQDLRTHGYIRVADPIEPKVVKHGKKLSNVYVTTSTYRAIYRDEVLIGVSKDD